MTRMGGSTSLSREEPFRETLFCRNGRTLKPVTVLYRNTVVVDSNSTPTVPSNPAAVVDGNKATFSFGASYRETDQKVISYNLRIGRNPGGIDVLSPLSNVNTGFRRAPKSGNIGAKTFATMRNLARGRTTGAFRQSIINTVPRSLRRSSLLPLQPPRRTVIRCCQGYTP